MIKRSLRIIPVFLLMIAGSVPCLYAQQAKEQKTYTLNGDIRGADGGLIYLIRYDPILQKVIKDSSQINNGVFQFKGALSEPTQLSITTSKSPWNDLSGNTASIFLEPGNLTISLQKDDFKNAVVSGSATQREMDQLNRLKAPYMLQIAPLQKKYQETNEQYIAAMKRTKNEDTLQFYLDRATLAKDAMDPLGEKLDEVDRQFINDHPASYVSAYLMQYKTGSMTAAEVASILHKMPPEVQQSSYGKHISEELEKLEKGSPGASAYHFSGLDINGKAISLADFKGKYVMLDFWASWCVPCRKGNPHLKDLYHQYKEKGFEIVGISDDDYKPDAWRKAVEKDGIGIWRHLLRGLQRTSTGYDGSKDINEHFGIHTLPTKILIDPKGIIIGRYGGGGQDDVAMDKKLAEIFGKAPK